MAKVIWQHGGEDHAAKEYSKGGTASLTARISEAANDVLALAAVDAEKPATYTVGLNTLVFDQIKLSHIECDIYEAVVSYVDPDKQKEEDESDEAPQWSWDTTGGTTHITHGFQVRNAFPAANEANIKNMFGGAINVERDQKGQLKVHGIDVDIPALTATLSFKIPSPADPPALARQLARATGKTNSAVWHGFQIGEALFRGARISGKWREKWDMQYLFAFSENITEDDNFTIPNVGVITKRGHDFLWVFYEPSIDEVNNQLVAVPRYAFTHQIYREFDFGDLGLGGGA